MGIIIVGVNASRAINLFAAMNPVALFIPVHKIQFNTSDEILVNSYTPAIEIENRNLNNSGNAYFFLSFFFPKENETYKSVPQK